MKAPEQRRPFYRWLSTHTQGVDVVVMLLVWLITCVPLFGYFMRSGVSLMGVVEFVAYSCLVIPLAWRRTRPVLAGTLVAAVCVVQVSVGASLLPPNVSVLLIVYALAAYAPRWASLGGLALALLGGALAVLRYEIFWTGVDTRGWTESIAGLVFLWSFVAMAWLLGDVTRSRRLVLEQLTDRARRLELEQEQERRLAAADERARIAREMHDVVAHSLSVMIAQADGGRYAARADPELATQTLETIARAGRESLAEMRRLLGVLRDDEAGSRQPVPGLDDLPELIESVRQAGVPVQFDLAGEPRRPLPQGAELAAYRVVQEALTNVLKHAGPVAHVTGGFSWDQHGLTIVVRDDGRGAAAAATDGVGQGISGMQDRVALYGGTLVAQPRVGGGFAVHAHIPYGEKS